jgi:transmembrane sensor
MRDPQLARKERRMFEAWFNADPRHRAAYMKVERAWSNAGEVASDPRVRELRRQALAQPKHRRARIWAAAAAVTALVAGIALLGIPGRGERIVAHLSELANPTIDTRVVATELGQHSTVQLSDASVVTLDADSRIEVEYTRDLRRVRLVSGQAWFQVAKNVQRPFVVEAGGQRITALGTVFDVRLGGPAASVQVTLVEGRVAVEAIESPLARLIGSPPHASVLSPGDSLVVSNSRPVVTQRADVANIGSWRQGQLAFDDDSLASAIEEINRYSSRQIVLADPSLAALRVSGVFKAGHSESFIETVTGHYPIKVLEQSEARVVLAPR